MRAIYQRDSRLQTRRTHYLYGNVVRALHLRDSETDCWTTLFSIAVKRQSFARRERSNVITLAGDGKLDVTVGNAIAARVIASITSLGETAFVVVALYTAEVVAYELADD